jgi:hypothetical protein
MQKRDIITPYVFSEKTKAIKTMERDHINNWTRYPFP